MDLSSREGPNQVQRPTLRALDGGPGALERLLTVRQVAEQLGVATALVYSLVKHGELPHVRVSSAIRFERPAVEAYLARGRS